MKNIRKKYDAILPSSKTVIADNPTMEHKKKIILDRELKTDFNSKIYEQGEMMQSEGTVTLPEKFDLKNKDNYQLVIKFDDIVTLSADLNISNYFDSNAFKRDYTYEGNDLGVNVKDGKTTFKLWAPASNKVSV